MTMIVDAYPRPDVSAEEYGHLEARADQIYLQLPYANIGESLIVMDLVREKLRRRIADERLPRHTKRSASLDALVSDGSVVRLYKD